MRQWSVQKLLLNLLNYYDTSMRKSKLPILDAPEKLTIQETYITIPAI